MRDALAPLARIAATVAMFVIAAAVVSIVDAPDAMAATQPNKLHELSGELIASLAIVLTVVVWAGGYIITHFVDRFVANTTDIYPDGEGK